MSNAMHQISEKKCKFRVNDLDLPQNLMGSSLARVPSLHQVWCKLVQYFLPNPANKQTDTGENIAPSLGCHLTLETPPQLSGALQCLL